MNRRIKLAATAIAALMAAPLFADEPADAFGDALAAVQQEWAVANYEIKDAKARADAFAKLVDHAAAFRAQYPQHAEALAWEGIVLSTYAGEVGAMSAMKHAKAARSALENAAKLDATALAGGIYASLGALYSKVPGGFIGFGDDERAAEYFAKALEEDPDNIDNNYFYGEFLLDQGDYGRARTVLEHALAAPPIADRPVFDAGRRQEIRALLAMAERKTAS
jgi:tetratricopeptide (TPR) repeat protein